MANNSAELPEGFVLDTPPAQAQQSSDTGQLPAGFVLDQPQRLADGSVWAPNGTPGQVLSQGPAAPGVIQNAINQVGNFGRVTANNATLGAADYITGKLGADNGIGVAGERALTNQAAMDLGHYGNAAAGLTGGVLQGGLIPAGGPVRSALGATAMGGGQAAAADYNNPANKDGVLGINPSHVAAGAGLGLLGAMGGNAFGFANEQVTGRLQPNIRDQYNLLQNNGVQVSPGQAMSASDGSSRMLNLEAKRNNTEGFYPEQLNQFTQAVLAHAGIQNNRLVPDQLERTMSDVGGQMTALAARNPINDQGVLVPLYRSVQAQNQKWTTDHNGVPNDVMTAATNDIRSAAIRGNMTGEQYQDLTQRLGKESGGTNGVAAAGRMNQTLKDAMETHLTNTNPADLGEWQRLNTQYSNLNVLKNVADNSSSRANQGFVIPSELVTAVRQAQGSSSLALGRTDIGDLAQAGQSLIQPHPGVSPNHSFASGVGAAAGAGIGHHALGPAGAFVGKTIGEQIGGAVDSLIPQQTLAPLTNYSTIPGANQPQNRVIGNALGLGAGGALNPFTRATGQGQ